MSRLKTTYDKEIILDKLEIIGASIEQNDLLKKSKYNFNKLELEIL